MEMLRKSSSLDIDNKHEVKKQRVEQVVTALFKGENMYKRSNSTENIERRRSPFPMSIPLHETAVYKQMPNLQPGITKINKKCETTGDIKQEGTIESVLQNEKINEQSPKSAFVPHMQPTLVRPQAMMPCSSPSQVPIRHQMPYFPVPRNRGIHIDNKKSAILKVPRDKTYPFNVYDPRKTTQKPVKEKSKPSSSVKPYKKQKVKSPNTPNTNEYRFIEFKHQHPTIELVNPSKIITSNAPIAIAPKTLNTPINSVNKNNTPTSNHVNNNNNIKIQDVESMKKLEDWSISEVYEYLKTSDCSQYAAIFLEQEIDGKVLLLLDETNISKLLQVKMGPAIKLNATIRKLKKANETHE